MKRPIFSVKEMNKQEADIVNRSFQELYQHKIEEVLHTNSATSNQVKSFRSVETGLKVIDTASSTSMTVTVPFQTKYQSVLSIDLNDVGTAFSTIIQSFTASEMVVKINATSTSTKVKFFYRISGNQE